MAGAAFSTRARAKRALARCVRRYAALGGPLIGVLPGCGPGVSTASGSGADADTGLATTTAASSSASVTSSAPPSTTDGGPTPMSTSTAVDDGASGDVTSNGFIDEQDVALLGECNVYLQDCPRGFKCVPYGNDGGAWNDSRCSPIARNPDPVGAPCTVEGSQVTGLDSCAFGSICWDVDPKTNEGTCVAQCVGTDQAPICEDPDTFCMLSQRPALALCIAACNPLTQDCPEGQGCYLLDTRFVCGVDVSGPAGEVGDPCEFINTCDPGLLCVQAADLTVCEGGPGCCSPVCEVNDPMPPCEPADVCVPWFGPGRAHPGLENIGFCGAP